MPKIQLLAQETIDQIAAGEVVDRPSSVVKELVENAIDAGATAVTVEIKEGGISLIRITDNGCGIPKSEIPLAFLRHSTSKIRTVEDLGCISSLGFRGEALSSIAAVSRVELITKTAEELTGSHYVIEGGQEISLEEIGAPDGTTFLVKDLFYHTPARKKFLKSSQTEGTYIADIVEKLALSHPDVSFKFINNNQTKLHTSGNGNAKDLIYHVFGREIASSLLEIHYEGTYFSVNGFIGKPVVTRGNRNYENYYVNGRYVRSKLFAKAIEDAYKNFLMQHQYPFTMLHFVFDSTALDVNVHPAKMELRIDHNAEVYQELYQVLFDALSHRELIPSVPVGQEKTEKLPVYKESIPEPFEARRLNDIRAAVAKDSPYSIQYPSRSRSAMLEEHRVSRPSEPYWATSELKQKANATSEDGIGERQEYTRTIPSSYRVSEESIGYGKSSALEESGIQQTLSDYSQDFLTEMSRSRHRIVGQVFDTYWLVEFEDKLYIIDQHAAHEKVLYERKLKEMQKKEFTSQALNPPMLISLNAKEEESLKRYEEQISTFGYVVEPFGGREYVISGIPGNLYHMDMKDLFIEMLDDFSGMTGKEVPERILEKIASMSCKAAVKGNQKLSQTEMDALIDELLTLENPYHCPHGRPTIIAMTKAELEKKFKRIV